jgi:hypothetical protein
VPVQELPASIRSFLSHFVRSIEQLEILLLFYRHQDEVWTLNKVYDVILSTQHSVERWVEDLVASKLLERLTDTTLYRFSADEALRSQVAMLAEIYRTSHVRVIEAIYKRDTSPPPSAAQSFADAFKLNKPDRHS